MLQSWLHTLVDLFTCSHQQNRLCFLPVLQRRVWHLSSFGKVASLVKEKKNLIYTSEKTYKECHLLWWRHLCEYFNWNPQMAASLRGSLQAEIIWNKLKLMRTTGLKMEWLLSQILTSDRTDSFWVEFFRCHYGRGISLSSSASWYWNIKSMTSN